MAITLQGFAVVTPIMVHYLLIFTTMDKYMLKKYFYLFELLDYYPKLL